MPQENPFESARVTLRLDREADAFFRSQANRHGKSLSDYLKSLLMEGLVAMRIEEVEERLTALIEKVPASQPGQSGAGFSSEGLLALFTIEAALEEILRQRDPAAWIKVLDKARRRMKGGRPHDES